MVQLTLDIQFRASEQVQDYILRAFHSVGNREFKFSEFLHFGVDFDNMPVVLLGIDVENMDYGRFDGRGYLPTNGFQSHDYSIRVRVFADIYPIPATPKQTEKTDMFGPLPVGDAYWAGDYIVYHKVNGWVRYSEFIDELTPKFETMIEFVQVSETEIDLKDFKDGFDVVEVEKDTIEIDL